MRITIILLNLLIITPLFAQQLVVEGDALINGKISGVSDPVAPQDAATKAYIDAAVVQAMNTFATKGELFTSTSTGIVQDVDGNSYPIVRIGSQWWMAQNLRTTKYKDGTMLSQVSAAIDWSSLSTPAYCWYDTILTQYQHYAQDTFGALYNYYTVADTNSKNICPMGWHVPSDSEWTQLTDFLGGLSIAGGKLKSTGTVLAGNGLWQDPNTGATNESGFTGIPSGFRTEMGVFDNIGGAGHWWSSIPNSVVLAWYRFLTSNNENVNRGANYNGYGLAVRCIRD